ncbi:glycosyltransferase [Pedobacter sp. MC2016-14]|uniref:glycosyltransferase n=1 Tax=Pedobacter sp. MC2016-14 TaxID=2897327 RepID=UPI001E587F3B|nr:glycosyltransferase [Pedobacter sp. MC2016-14]MCD0490210.1 glycosyltransferase [Pedobacter sp. MC2016-14]
MDKPLLFEDITLLITHFNRSNSLERLLKRFAELNCQFHDIIVSDDCSNETHFNRLKELKEIYNFQIADTPVNKGLANNINKGQEKVQTPLTLYVQEDFVPKDLFPEKLKLAVQCMDERPDLDMVRFYAYFDYPYLKPYKGGFSEMIFKKFSRGYKKFYYYSDHPHLRRKNFLDKFGKYVEGIKSDRAEYRMMFAFIKAKGKALFYTDYKGLFDQINDAIETSTVKRNFLREGNGMILTAIRHLYRHIRFNFDLFR